MALIDELSAGVVEIQLGNGQKFAKRNIESGIEEKIVVEIRQKVVDPGPFAIGSHNPTLADAFIIPQMFNASRFCVTLDEYPILMSVEKACLEHPWFKSSHPDIIKKLENQ